MLIFEKMTSNYELVDVQQVQLEDTSNWSYQSTSICCNF